MANMGGKLGGGKSGGMGKKISGFGAKLGKKSGGMGKSAPVGPNK